MPNIDVPAKASIRQAAYRLALARGLSATTYSDIAATAGCSRALVQYYLPTKSHLATELIRDLVAGIEDAVVRQQTHARADLMAYRFTVVQLYFAFLLDPAVRPFTLDILGNRAFLETVLMHAIEWNSQVMGISYDSDRTEVESAIVALSGTHGLLHWQLSRGESPDPCVLAERVMQGSVAGTDVDVVSLRSTFVAGALGDYELKDAVVAVRMSLSSLS